VANTLKLSCNGVVGFIDWLDARRGTNISGQKQEENNDADVPDEHTSLTLKRRKKVQFAQIHSQTG
jgi:hypothetical protein